MLIRSRHRQKGLHTVEMAIVSSLFFVVLFAVLEIGRALFIWNVLEEGARRGARLAAVCPPSSIATLQSKAIFDDSLGLINAADVTTEIEYLDEDGVLLGDPSTEFTLIRYVRVVISNYSFSSIIPLIDFTVNAPEFTSILPKESLGVAPFGYTSPAC